MSEPTGSGQCAARPRPSATTAEPILAATRELMSELIARNELEPADFVSVIFTCTDDLERRVPRRRRPRARPRPGAAALQPRDRRARGDAAGDPGARPLLRARRPRARPTSTSARPRSCAPTCIPRNDRHLRPEARRDPRLHRRGARRQGAGGDRRLRHRPARLQRVAVGAAPGGRRGDRARRRGREPLSRTRPRPCCGGGSPSATRSTPAQVAVANGSCEILLAAALALCEPGAELVYAWPSFSIYPYLAPLSGAREIRVAARRRRRARPRRDARRDHRRDPAADRLQPQQPDRAPTCRRRGSPSSASASPTT